MTDLWQIWIDTGGTFTDCLAVDPRHPVELKRAKVLSISALRGRVARAIGASRFVVEQSWGACDDLIAGFEFVVRAAGPERRARVLGFDAAASILELDRPLEAPLADAQFEVRSPEPAPILAARLATQTPAGKPLPPVAMRLATTRGTNALLERRGVSTALFITRGFADLLLIGDQQRPDIFALQIEKPAPLFTHAVEVSERLNPDGSVLVPLDVASLKSQALKLASTGVRAAAVALVHSYCNPAHEQQAAAILRSCGFEHVSCSADLAPLIRILPRAQTAVVDAYLSPVIDDYLRSVERCIGSGSGSTLHVMTSAGGLVGAPRYRACDSLLSGPAGGVGGAAAAARLSGVERIIGFDMGGTSTDVSRYDGDFDYRFEHRVGGAKLLAPALAVESVAAGGGSICEFIDERLRVGPRSASAFPGPACYGAGGPLTITDVNLLLGRLDAAQFEIPISIAPAQDAAARLCTQVRQASRERADHAAPDELLLQGLLDIANQRMAAAIEEISVRQGYEPKDYALVAFGGAGGQHACAVAELLGMHTIIMPHDASLLSAFGLGAASIERVAQRQILKRLDRVAEELPSIVRSLDAESSDALADEGVPRDRIAARRRIFSLRMLGQDAALAIELDGLPSDRDLAAALQHAFVERYEATYGHQPPLDRKPVELESIRTVASAPSPQLRATPAPVQRFNAAPDRVQHVWFDGQPTETPVHDRLRLRPGATLNGPALVLDPRSSCVIQPGWSAAMDSAGALILTRSHPRIPREAAQSAGQVDVARAELFSNRLGAIAAEMGQMLQRTALSTNVKERLDFSCAILDSAGDLVVNAPHIPVHLGALGECVRSVRKAIAMDDGDVIVTNHPAFGGSHLPDVTVITPAYERGTLLGYLASRAHHAEIGGIRPGSMPPDAANLAQEGVVIAPQYLIRGGQPRFDQIESLLRSGPHPSRAVPDNLADLQAAVAANQRGAVSLRALARAMGGDGLALQMEAIKARGERLARHAFAALPQPRMQATEHLDDGSPISLAFEIIGGRASIDFTGSAPRHPGNLNCTPAVVRSAVIYVLRLLIGQRLALSEGLMRAVDLCIPPGMLSPPFVDDPALCPAVVGGNVETSQRIVDTLIKALQLCACGQGTMNNVLFGNDRFGYYETVCGGAGAGPGFHGADAVHTHMTNTRITDVEVIEHRYPVRVDRFALRSGSGGAGQYRGGCGVVRELAFLAPMSLSLLTQHRTAGPFGLHGGKPGASGHQHVVRGSGQKIDLGSIDGCQVQIGDRLILQTPGGGGWGPPP